MDDGGIQGLGEYAIAELKREITLAAQRLELARWLADDLDAADLGEVKTEELHARMAEAMDVLRAVADHLGLEDDEARLAMTMKAFDKGAHTR